MIYSTRNECNTTRHTVIRIENLVDDEREELLRHAALVDALLAVELHVEALFQVVRREARDHIELLATHIMYSTVLLVFGHR